MDLFTSGSIEPGTRLPPERHLAASLGVGRSAVREALAALEILGIVDVRPGSGTYLRGTASELLPQTLGGASSSGRGARPSCSSCALGWRSMSPASRRRALRHPSCERLRVRLERMRASFDDLRAFARADLDFHHALAAAAGNATLVDLLHVVRSLLQVYADRAVHDETEASIALGEHECGLSSDRGGR